MIMENVDLRIQKYYKSLIENFEGLLNEKEFEKISVTEICDAAMIRRPTFYQHFLDKYDFLTFFIKHKMNLIFDYAFQNINEDRKSTRLNSSHVSISYAVFCLKKKK